MDPNVKKFVDSLSAEQRQQFASQLTGTPQQATHGQQAAATISPYVAPHEITAITTSTLKLEKSGTADGKRTADAAADAAEVAAHTKRQRTETAVAITGAAAITGVNDLSAVIKSKHEEAKKQGDVIDLADSDDDTSSSTPKPLAINNFVKTEVKREPYRNPPPPQCHPNSLTEEPEDAKLLFNFNCATGQPASRWSVSRWSASDVPVPTIGGGNRGPSQSRRFPFAKLGGHIDLEEGKRKGLQSMRTECYGPERVSHLEREYVYGYNGVHRLSTLQRQVLTVDGYRNPNSVGVSALLEWRQRGWVEDDNTSKSSSSNSSSSSGGTGNCTGAGSGNGCDASSSAAVDQLLLLEHLKDLAIPGANDFGDRCIHTLAWLPKPSQLIQSNGQFTLRFYVFFRKSLFGLSAHPTICTMMTALQPVAKVDPTRQPHPSTGSLLPSPTPPNASIAAYDFTLPAVLRAAESHGFPVALPEITQVSSEVIPVPHHLT
jgi:hypothetical protein